jgi:arginine-tRNA-protein transferase
MYAAGSYSPYPALPPPVDVPMATPQPHACPYLPDRQTTLRAFYAPRMPPELYHQFQDAGFRRAGLVVYQPVCRSCRQCMPIRIPIAEFAPGKSLRRCARRNGDVTIHIDAPTLTDEKRDIYRRYLLARHPAKSDEDCQSLEEFLYRSPVDTVEFNYRLQPGGRLIAIGICDVCTQSLSSVYFYFDPDESRRGLGNFGALMEIDYARRKQIPYWYLGFWVKGCRAMDYKAGFRPHDLLHPDGVWRRAEAAIQSQA